MRDARQRRRAAPLHVSLVAVPDVMASTLFGLYDVLNAFAILGKADDSLPSDPPFHAEIVGHERGPMDTASGTPVVIERRLDEVADTDIVIVPSVMVPTGAWQTGEHAELVAWLERAHGQGSLLCSACSGVLLLAETGLLAGREAAIHWAFAGTFRRNFPDTHVRLEDMLVATGEREEFVMTGASMSWHDLVLYLIARFVGATAAQSIARFFALQWHAEGQAPFVTFDPVRDHGDGCVRQAQVWLDRHFADVNPVGRMVELSGVPERSFKRRFTRATGLAPIAYVQRLRVDDAKRRLERTETPVEEIAWQVGYEDPAAFRRLFKRLNGISPVGYRRKYRVPRVEGTAWP
ncbi:MAG: helix-turn-helix domain-containing protein [Azospirillaceae bacterium]